MGQPYFYCREWRHLDTGMCYWEWQQRDKKLWVSIIIWALLYPNKSQYLIHFRLTRHGTAIYFWGLTVIYSARVWALQTLTKIKLYNARVVDSLSPSRAFTVGNDVIWTQVCVVENGSSEIKSYGCPLFFRHCYIQIKTNTLFTFD